MYVPADCLDEAASTEVCHLHVAFHGCQQYTDLIDDDFYWDAGYNAWAEANRIVVLYPQTKAWDRPSDTTGFTGQSRGMLGLVGVQRRRLLPPGRQADAGRSGDD